jgi:hypothetical protein
MFSRAFLQQVAALAQEEEDILRIMTVFPAWYTYKSHPTYDQFKPFCKDAVAAGYSLASLYRIFASGKIPSDLDALTRKHVPHWRPAGEIIESEFEIKRIQE